MSDKIVVAENCVYSTDSKETGLNNNVLIVGTSGCGKTMSVTEPTLLATTEHSVVVTLTKRTLVKQYETLFAARGYHTWDLNLAKPETSKVCYDPIRYIKNYQDITFLAKSIVLAGKKEENIKNDPYWDNAAECLISALIAYSYKLGKKSMAEVVDMMRGLNFQANDRDGFTTALDGKFRAFETMGRAGYTLSCWNSFRKLPVKTAACVYGMACVVMDKIFSPELVKMFRVEEKLDFERMSEEKTVLFVTTSPVNPALSCFVNLFYAQVFKSLFEYAESKDSGELTIPVHVICDDFATGSQIQNFPEYISIFRAKKISVTLLLQSESQLETMYGQGNATTIINNCDTYCYMGSMDLQTAKNISQRIDEPVAEVLNLPLGEVLVFRRGTRPVRTRRYQTEEDEAYIKLNESKHKEAM